MKKLSVSLLVAFLAVLAMAGAGRSGEQPVIELKFGHGNVMNHACHIYSQQWADKVREATNGRIQITIYPAGQLGTLVEMQEAVELGTLDICLADTSLLSNTMPKFGIVALPFLVDGYEHAEKVYDSEIVTALNEELAREHGMRPLGWMWNGFRLVCTTKPINSIGDCKNIKLRSPEAEIYITTFNTLGMKPTPLPWGDTYTAMQTGIVDGMESGAEAICTQGFYKLGNNVWTSRHIFSVVGPCINEDKWQSLSSADQELLLKLLKESVVAEREFSRSGEQGFIDEMRRDGANITETADKKALADLFSGYWNSYAKACGGEDVLSAIVALR